MKVSYQLLWGGYLDNKIYLPIETLNQKVVFFVETTFSRARRCY